MSQGRNDRFDAVDALLREVAEQQLPAPAERLRLRIAAGLSQQQVAGVVGVSSRMAVGQWESGEREPRAPHRALYARLLAGLAEQFPASGGSGSAPGVSAPGPAAEAAGGDPAPVSSPVPAGVTGRQAAVARTGKRRTGPVPKTSSTLRAADGDGPLAVLDGEGTAHCPGGQILSCPAATVPALVEWTLAETRLGAPRLHQSGQDADPLIVLTAGAVARLGLPATAPLVADPSGGRRLRRLPEGHPVLAGLDAAGWQLTKRGFGPWARVYRPVREGRRRCVQLCLLPWGALEERAWGPAAAGELPAPELARVLGAYSSRVLTPRGTTAVTGLDLMTALRPPTRPVQAEDGSWVSGPVSGSLTQAVDPAPPEAPDGHPLVGHRPRTPESAVIEEAYDWARDPETLTDAECAMPYAVGLDVNVAFLAAANRLPVGLGAPEHRSDPVFDKRTPGCWLVDLSGVELDERLPSPFTPDGSRPAGPAWYATPTVAYAAELGVDVRPLEAWVRPEKGGYLDPWYTRLRDAYLATMAELGVTAGMNPRQFLEATAGDVHKDTDPGEAAVLAAVKATVKGGIGKLAEKAAGRGWRPGQPWPALERPTWRPDIRAAVIAQARTGMHRRMRRMAEHGHYPLGVLSDCVVYPSAGPSPLDLLPAGGDGQPLAKGVFVLGAAPGRVKHEGTMTLLAAVEMLDQGGNPAQHVKGTDAVLDGGE